MFDHRFTPTSKYTIIVFIVFSTVFGCSPFPASTSSPNPIIALPASSPRTIGSMEQERQLWEASKQAAVGEAQKREAVGFRSGIVPEQPVTSTEALTTFAFIFTTKDPTMVCVDVHGGQATTPEQCPTSLPVDSLKEQQSTLQQFKDASLLPVEALHRGKEEGKQFIEHYKDCKIRATLTALTLRMQAATEAKGYPQPDLIWRIRLLASDAEMQIIIDADTGKTISINQAVYR